MNDMNRPNEKDIKGWNAEYQWHPFADPNATAEDKPLIIAAGKDVLVTDIDGVIKPYLGKKFTDASRYTNCQML
jgi:adenosylmethionine-8-amino-7-oxononanoate aminotransferase